MARLLPAIIAAIFLAIGGRSLVFIAGSMEARVAGRFAPSRKQHQGITMKAKAADSESSGLFRWIGVFLETAVGGEALGKAKEQVASAPSSGLVEDIMWPIRSSLSLLFGGPAEQSPVMQPVLVTVPSTQVAPERFLAEKSAFTKAAALPSVHVTADRVVAEKKAITRAAVVGEKAAPTRVSGFKAAMSKLVQKVRPTSITSVPDIAPLPTPPTLQVEAKPTEKMEDMSKQLRNLLMNM